jgi:hypothetical protein
VDTMDTAQGAAAVVVDRGYHTAAPAAGGSWGPHRGCKGSAWE